MFSLPFCWTFVTKDKMILKELWLKKPLKSLKKYKSWNFIILFILCLKRFLLICKTRKYTFVFLLNQSIFLQVMNQWIQMQWISRNLMLLMKNIFKSPIKNSKTLVIHYYVFNTLCILLPSSDHQSYSYYLTTNLTSHSWSLRLPLLSDH